MPSNGGRGTQTKVPVTTAFDGCYSKEFLAGWGTTP